MTQLDPHTRQALCALDQPPPGVEDRVFAAISAATGGGGGGGGSDGGGTGLPIGGESTLAYAAKVVGATLGLTAAGFALVAASAVGIRSTRSSPQPHVAAAPAVVAAPNIEAPPTTADTLAPTEPEIQPAIDETDPPLVRERNTDAPKPAPAAAPTLEAELALLELARSSAPKEALAALERHRVEFQHGMLADEREVLRVETLCALGRASEAQTAAAEFLAGKPNSPLRSRLEPTCKKS